MTNITKPRAPTSVDQYIGENLRRARVIKKLSQEALASQVSVSFQQLQKYEKGKNRISAGRLYELAKALNVSILFFYEGLPPTVMNKDDKPVRGRYIGR